MALPSIDSQPPNCTRCGNVMEPGFIATAGRLNWVTELGTLDSAVGVGEPIIRAVDSAVKISHLRAWRCTNCRLILVDYGLGVIHTSRETKAKWNPP